MIRKATSYALLVSTYCLTWLVATAARMVPRQRWTPNGRILVTGTIFNPNWYLSHITPLVRSGVKEVVLVIDEPLQPMEGVRFACPPTWLAKLIGRAGAKVLWVLYAGIRYRPDLFMGYNLVAGGCTALAAGTILRRPTCYQMTGGQLVLSTVGVEEVDPEQMVRPLSRFRKSVERLAIRVIRQFDLVVVRGSKGKAFLAGHGIEENVVTITGSVRTAQRPGRHRDIDLVFVGRLNPIKQVDQFIQVACEAHRVLPSLSVVIVGDGPLKTEMQVYAARLGVADCTTFLGRREDVEEILARSKIFVLTSKSEGLSIAMAEAMANGAVPVVANVGELGDLVVDGVNGCLITPNRVAEYVEKMLPLLTDGSLWTRYSQAARDTARARCDIEVITKRWSQSLRTVVEPASGRDLSCA